MALNEYKTTSWFYRYFLCCFGFSDKRNGTIIALYSLIENSNNPGKDAFTQDDIKNAIKSKAKDDRHSAHRLGLFQGTEQKNGTATDDVVDKLREAFTPH